MTKRTLPIPDKMITKDIEEGAALNVDTDSQQLKSEKKNMTNSKK